jgi:uncharacterized protein
MYMRTVESILWRGLFLPGHESCALFSQENEWHLQGTAVFSHEQHPCRLSYHIVCDTAWRTRSTHVEGWLDRRWIDLQIKTDLAGHWWLNDVEQPQLTGCVDIDLNFSPSTNLIPIRRLDLATGEAADVRAAWLRFPSFQLEPFPQEYRRLNEDTYRYESSGGEFTAELKVNPSGFVIDYQDLWQAEAFSSK